MVKRVMLFSLLLGCYGVVLAQTLPDTLRQKYERNTRDVKVVKEYSEALEAAKMKKEAETVVKEYMARCPVLQIEDKDTYLLINQYVFSDPYSNVFEYGIYAMRKMKWDREEKALDSKQARLMSIFKGMSKGVSGGDEIDKRYEVLVQLSSNLNKEIGRQCEPVHQKENYTMPVYDSPKMERLEYLANKGELLGQDGMRVKLELAKAIQTKDFSKAVRELCVAADLNVTGVRGSYSVGILNVLADQELDKEDIGRVLEMVLRLNEREKEMGGTTNYYHILGRLYHLYGDDVNGEKCTRIGDTIEADRMARYEEMMKAFNNK